MELFAFLTESLLYRANQVPDRNRARFLNLLGIGLRPASAAHGIANVKHPAEQGVVGLAEVFIDTILVCSMTAFIILSSGMWTDPSYQQASGDLTAAAMSTSIPFAAAVATVPVVVMLLFLGAARRTGALENL